MQKYIPVIALSIFSLSLLWTIYRRQKTSQEKSKSSTKPTNKPQSSFKSHIRNNQTNNPQDFYTAQHHEDIKIKIENLNLNKTPIETKPDLKLIDFNIAKPIFITAEETLKQLIDNIVQNHSVIGLDIEQTNLNSYQGYNCLIQISTPDGGNFVIDAIALHDILPGYLKLICENENIVKVFYAGGSDLLWLNRDYGVFVVNYFDVQLASIFDNNKNDSSLPGLLKQYCNFTLDRATKKKLQVSDWRTRPLTQEQLSYAALDAHYLIYLRNALLESIKSNKDEQKIIHFLKQMQTTCVKTYQLRSFSLESFALYFDEEIKKERKELKAKNSVESQDMSHLLTQKKRIFLSLCKLRDNIARETDENPENIFSSKDLIQLTINSNHPDQKQIITFENHSQVHISQIQNILAEKELIDLSELPQKVIKDQNETINAKLLRKKKFEAENRVKEIYEDCKLLAPDGDLLCYTNRKKIAWYLNKNIGVLVQEEPPIIKLNFEPSSRGYSDMRDMNIDRSLYVGQYRLNQCVVCGQKENLLKYHVVPSLYRQYFPLEMKAHRAHDVLLMCERCLEKANKESHKFKEEIATRYDVPLVEFDKPQNLKNTVEGIKRALVSLNKHQESMPKENKKKIKEDIRKMFETITVDDADGFKEEFRESLIQLERKPDGKVKFTAEFFELFHSLKNPKSVVVKQVSNKEFRNMHGKIILEKFTTTEELKAFIEEWRMYFIKALDPQFLPYDWDLALKKRFADFANLEKLE